MIPCLACAPRMHLSLTNLQEQCRIREDVSRKSPKTEQRTVLRREERKKEKKRKRSRYSVCTFVHTNRYLSCPPFPARPFHDTSAARHKIDEENKQNEQNEPSVRCAVSRVCCCTFLSVKEHLPPLPVPSYFQFSHCFLNRGAADRVRKANLRRTNRSWEDPIDICLLPPGSPG